MLRLTPEALEGALRAVGLEAGDNVMVHAALQFLGRAPEGPALHYECLSRILGSGTLAVPAFTFAFARGEGFSRSSPSEGMGAFSEYVRGLPEAVRSCHPLQSVVAVGPLAAEVCGTDTVSGYEEGSPFARMVELDFKILLLGAGIEYVSLVHYCEQRHSVPYRYWKVFDGLVDGEPRSYRMFVRDLELDPRVDQTPLKRVLQERGQWSGVGLNYGEVACFRMRDYVAVTDHLLAADPWALVLNPRRI